MIYLISNITQSDVRVVKRMKKPKHNYSYWYEEPSVSPLPECTALVKVGYKYFIDDAKFKILAQIPELVIPEFVISEKKTPLVLKNVVIVEGDLVSEEEVEK